MRIRSILVVLAVSAAAAQSLPALAVPFEARPPHLRAGDLLADPTVVGAIADSKRKLVLFLQAVPGSVQAIEILGTLLLNEGQHEQAEKLLRQGAAAAPQQVSLRLRLAVALLNQQKFADAAPHLQFAVEQDPDDVLALTNYGWLLAVLERNPEALAIYERLNGKEFEGKVNRTELFVGLTVLYYRLGRHDDTVALLAPEFAKVAAPHPNNRIFLNLVDAYTAKGRLDDAAKALDRLDALVPADNPGPALARARLLAAQGKEDAATALLAKTLASYPKAAADIHLTQARIDMERKYLRRAADAFAKAADTAEKENRAPILGEMAQGFVKAGKPAEATRVLERFATTGGNTAITLLFAENLVQSGRKADAISLLDRVIAATPDVAQAHLMRAIVLRGEKRISEAEMSMRKSVNIDPTNAGAWHMLADLAHDTKGDKAMLAILREGLEHNPTDPNLLLGVGSLSYSQGDVAYASEIFGRMVARFPDNPVALSGAALAELDLGRNISGAREKMEKAVKLAPRVPAVVDTWGWMLHKTGKTKEAIGLLTRLAEAVPDDGGVLYHLGVAYADSGQEGLARAAFRKALALGVPQHYRDDLVRRLSPK
jgi:tetratricopeptide (TPR) repeat protein